jgi:NAD(P)-dependent dehydrogenase (short-subunit alcohol dehydrogenase family)
VNGRTTGEEVLGGRDLRGKVALVTGGHSGIGLETTRGDLSKAGAAIVVGAQDVDKAKANLTKIVNAEAIRLDLANPGSIDSFADAFLKSYRPVPISQAQLDQVSLRKNQRPNFRIPDSCEQT